MNEELVTNLLTNGLPLLEGKKAYPRNQRVSLNYLKRLGLSAQWVNICYFGSRKCC